MKTILHTVSGDISPQALGLTLMHEHICCADWSMRANFGPRFCDTDRVLDRAVTFVRKAQAAGVTAMVDGTAINLGRDIHLLRAVARQTGIHLIASSGFYDQDEPWLAEQDAAFLYDLLDYECKNGIAGTDSKPGIMKCAVGLGGLTETRKKILSLTAKAALANDLPLFCHHEWSTKAGPAIVDFLLQQGMDPKRIILGHCGDANDPEYLLSVARLGCYLGEDRAPYGLRFHASAQDRARNLAVLWEKGYADQILASNDLCVFLGFWEPMEDTLARTDGLYEDADYTFVLRTLLPELKQYGLTEAAFRHILVENPRAFFSH